MRTGDVVRVKKTPTVIGLVKAISDADIFFIEVQLGTGIAYGYAEHELERLDPVTGEPPVDKIAEYYRAAEERQAREMARWLAAGKSIQTFVPRTLLN